MFYNSKAQPIHFSDQQKGTKNVTCTICRQDKSKVKKRSEKLELNILKIHSNINNVCIRWRFQNVFHNLRTRFSQFTDKKKPKIAQTVQIELSTNSNATRTEI